jgi:hypothetical protein
MPVPPVKGAQTISLSARVVKTAMVVLFQDGVITRCVAAYIYIYSLSNPERPRRRLREVLGQAQIGMERRGSTHTSQTHGSAMSSYLSDDTRCSCIPSDCVRVLLGQEDSAGERVWSGNLNF